MKRAAHFKIVVAFHFHLTNLFNFVLSFNFISLQVQIKKNKNDDKNVIPTARIVLCVMVALVLFEGLCVLSTRLLTNCAV